MVEMSTPHTRKKQETKKRIQDPDQMSCKARRKYFRKLLFLEGLTRTLLENLRKK